MGKQLQPRRLPERVPGSFLLQQLQTFSSTSQTPRTTVKMAVSKIRQNYHEDCEALISPSSIRNSAKASSTSWPLNLSPQVINECLNISASIFPLISNASNDLRMVSSSSAPPAIFSAKRVTICVKLTGPGASPSMPDASPSEMDLPTAPKAFFKSEADRMPSLSVSMMPKASLNSWICLWENMAKMLEPERLAFLDPDPLAIL